MSPRVWGVLLGALIGLVVGIGGYTFVYARGYSYLGNDPATCANCHVIGEPGQQSASDVAPTFHAIANRRETTAEGLRTFLSTPHADAMKGIVLPRLEIDDLVAYIMSLREH